MHLCHNLWYVVLRKKASAVSLEQGCQLCLCGISGILSLMAGIGFSEDDIIAEIAPALFNNPFRLRFPAIIVGADLIKSAIQAAVKIRPTKDTDIPSANRGAYFQFL